MFYAIDTHALVWFLENNERLSARAKAILIEPTANLIIPTLALAEIAHLYARKRIGIDVGRVLNEVANAENCTVYPLDDLVVNSISGELDIHDAIIVATAKVYQDILGESVAIVTRDKMIAASGLIPTIW